MGNCLKTTLKETVSNENLAKLNTITLDLIPGAKRQIVSQQNSHRAKLVFSMNTGGSIHVESKIDLYKQTSASSISSTATRSFNVSSSSNMVQYDTAALSSLTQDGIEKCITITGDIYKIRTLFQGGSGNVFSIEQKQYNGLGSLSYASGLIIFGGGFVDANGLIDIPTTRFVLQGTLDKEYALENALKNVSYVCCSDIRHSGNPTNRVTIGCSLTEELSKNTSIRAIGLRCFGDIVNLPVNTRLTSELTGGFTGNVEDYINRVRSVRTEGKLAISCSSSVKVKYNGTLLTEISSSNKYSYGGKYYCVFSWDENSITMDKTSWDATLQNDADNIVIPKLY